MRFHEASSLNRARRSPASARAISSASASSAGSRRASLQRVDVDTVRSLGESLRDVLHALEQRRQRLEVIRRSRPRQRLDPLQREVRMQPVPLRPCAVTARTSSSSNPRFRAGAPLAPTRNSPKQALPPALRIRPVRKALVRLLHQQRTDPASSRHRKSGRSIRILKTP